MKVDEETTTDNVMSVEVAIRRELEYRRKMEALQFHLPGDSDDSDRAIKQSQEPPHVVGRKRKASASNLQYFPVPQPSCSYQPFLNHPTSLACKICEQTFSNSLYLKQHCMGQKHQLKLMRMKSTQKNGGVPDTDVNNPYWCSLCQAGCSSAYTLEQHLIGKRHATSVHAMEDAKQTAEQQVEISNIEWEPLKTTS